MFNLFYNFSNLESLSPIQYFKNGRKIKIKPSHRGLFTEYCGGKVTDACILKGKNSNDPKIRKRATFAANSRKWNKKEGGTFGLNIHSPSVFPEVTLMSNLDFVQKIKKRYGR